MTTARLLVLACAMLYATGCGDDDLDLCNGCTTATPTPTPTTTSTAATPTAPPTPGPTPSLPPPL